MLNSFESSFFYLTVVLYGPFTYLIIWTGVCGCVAVMYNSNGNQPTQVVPSRPQLPDYYTATKRLAERRGQLVTSQTNGVIGRRARSCDSLATPPERHWRCVHLDESDLSEDGRNFFIQFCSAYIYFAPKLCSITRYGFFTLYGFYSTANFSTYTMGFAGSRNPQNNP